MSARAPVLLLLWLALAPVSGIAASDKPHEVQDLPYGEVLFHFYQRDYFTAITHLMVARKEHLLKHQDQDAELLLAGLELAYGMLDQAETRFRRLLVAHPDDPLYDRVWYNLARINYQRGHYRKALDSLEQMGKPHDEAMAGKLALLRANIDMKLGRDSTAAEALEKVRVPDGQQEYIDINRGIALLRSGQVERGRRVLDKLGKQAAGTEELRALRDRANLSLGYQLLRSGDPESARNYLNRVRLQGPFVQAAMLGAGWADAELGDYESALTPWMNLLIVGGHQPPVQEARLAVPYAFAQMGDGKRAADFYQKALGYYDEEQKHLEQAIDAARSGTLISHLGQVDTGASGGWLNAAPTLKGVPSGRYLVDLLSGDRFQESLKNFRDLGYLSTLLQRWLDNMAIYHDMVDARRQAYAERAPKVRARLARHEAAALQKRWQRYSDELAADHKEGDPLSLATGKEKQQWARLEKIGTRLAGLPDQPRYNAMRAKAGWLKGVLYWRLQEDYKIRWWNTHKALAALEPQVQKALAGHQQVSEALVNIKSGFDGYDKRIEALRARILALLPHIASARERSAQRLQHLVLDELDTRKQRLASYRSQARYALARSYDQLTNTPGAQP